MTVGRKRTDGNPLGLEQRVYWKAGQWQYRHRDGRWEKLGTDVARANARARIYNDPDKRFGTLGYFIELHIAEARAGRLVRKLAPRTIRDYETQSVFLIAGLGKFLPTEIVDHPELLSEYRDARSAPDDTGRGAPVRANRELSQLSAMYSWLIERGLCPGLRVNPVDLITRNPEKPKERYVEDHEYRTVFSIAQRSVCMAMETVYKTLQRPQDVLSLSATNIRRKEVAGTATRVLSVTQGKRGRIVDIEIDADLEATLRMLTPNDGEIGRIRGRGPRGSKVTRIVPLVHDLAGERYTIDGIGAMLRRYCKLAGIKTFGLMDIRAKGATDMYLAGEPLEKIQQLMGHKSVTTTEIYIKRLLGTIRIAKPNTIRTVASSA